MAQVSAITAEPRSTPAFARRRAATPRRGVILLVEDRQDVRVGLAQLLQLNGYLVVDAADAERALAYLNDDPSDYALILLDLLLPGPLSGADLRAVQLADARLASIPTVVVSACEPEAGAQLRLRPDAWLEKPFRGPQLLEIVRQYVMPEPPERSSPGDSGFVSDALGG